MAGERNTLRHHDVELLRGDIRLRPMTEDDWPILLEWNNDPEVLYFWEGDDITSWEAEPFKRIYRNISLKAYCFIIEFGAHPVGECWLQEMNLERILRRFPEEDCRRIDLSIGEKPLWGQGIGSSAIAMLTSFGFYEERADRIFACAVADTNPRCRAAFRKAGFREYQVVDDDPGPKANSRSDFMVTRAEFEALTKSD